MEEDVDVTLENSNRVEEALQNLTELLPDENIPHINDLTEIEADSQESNILPTIPEIPDSLLLSETRSRFSSAEWFNAVQEIPVSILGVGGIGSYVAFNLSRLGVSIISIYDPDTVEVANIAGQLYYYRDVGKPKVNAVKDICKQLSNYYNINTYSLFTDNSILYNVTICGFDNMTARRIAFNSWLNKLNRDYPEETSSFLYIDGRLNAEEFQVFCIQGNDSYSINKYQSSYLFDDTEVREEVCSYKQTTFCAAMIGSVITNLFINFVAREYCNQNRPLPFFTYYNASQLRFKTED